MLFSFPYSCWLKFLFILFSSALPPGLVNINVLKCFSISLLFSFLFMIVIIKHNSLLTFTITQYMGSHQDGSPAIEMRPLEHLELFPFFSPYPSSMNTILVMDIFTYLLSHIAPSTVMNSLVIPELLDFSKIVYNSWFHYYSMFSFTEVALDIDKTLSSPGSSCLKLLS